MDETRCLRFVRIVSVSLEKGLLTGPPTVVAVLKKQAHDLLPPPEGGTR